MVNLMKTKTMIAAAIDPEKLKNSDFVIGKNQQA